MSKCVRAAITVAWFTSGLLSAQAATVTWTGLGPNDNWNTSANWSIPPGNPPNFMDDAVIGMPAPTVMNVSGLVQSMQVDDGGLINMLAGNDLTLNNGGLTNFGQIVVNSDAMDLLSSINFNVTATIGGKGKIILNKPFVPGLPGFFPDRGATIESGNFITQNSNHTIEGAGRINATLVNEGTVRASNPGGGNTLVIAGTQQFNDNLFTSSTTGALQIIAALVTQGTSGRIVADTGNVTLTDTKIVGGALQSVSGGQFGISGTGARFREVHNQGIVNANVFLGLEGSGFVNDGTVNGGNIRFDDTMTVTGSGQFVLNNGNLQTLPPAVLTQGPNHSIRGKGTISAELVNNGLIEVTPPSGVPTPVMTFSAFNKTNNNIIRANAGTQIFVDAPVTFTQDPNSGRIIADSGIVQFNSGTGVVRGRVEASGTGRTEVRGSVSFTDVTVEGALNVRAGPTVQLNVLGNGMTNNGLITVNPAFANVAHTMFFDGQTAMTLDGTGEIVLNGPGSRAQITVATGKKLTQEFGHSITGFGLINGEFVNTGDVIGDSQFNPIVFTGTLAGTNHLENVRVTNIHSIGEGSIRAVPTFGTYELASTATALFEIGGTHPNDFDRLLGQTIMLDGILSLDQIDVGSGIFQPQLGNTFEIINGSNVMGTFDDVVTNGLDPWLDYDVHYDYMAGTVTLEAIRRYSADFDFDGDVDDDDLTEWEAGYGMNAGASFMDGDADEDGDVDGEDFLTWQQQYGSGLGPITAARAVPEPTAALLSLLAAAIVPRRTRKSFSRTIH